MTELPFIMDDRRFGIVPRESGRSPHDHGLTVKETPFEFLALQAVVDVTPIAPEKVVPPSGGLNTKTNTVPGCAMSAAVTAASNCWLLTKVVTRGEPFHFTTEPWRKSSPLTVRTNWLPPAVALTGETDAMDGAGGQLPQDSAAHSVIASIAKTGDLVTVAIGLHLRQAGG
jgi:hypothetical protein